MNITIDVNHHFPEGPRRDPLLEDILARVTNLQQIGAHTMSKLDELNQELIEINTTTNELAADVDDLLAKLANPGLSPEEADAVKAELQTLKGTLQGIAAKHTPTPQP